MVLEKDILCRYWKRPKWPHKSALKKHFRYSTSLIILCKKKKRPRKAVSASELLTTTALHKDTNQLAVSCLNINTFSSLVQFALHITTLWILNNKSRGFVCFTRICYLIQVKQSPYFECYFLTHSFSHPQDVFLATPYILLLFLLSAFHWAQSFYRNWRLLFGPPLQPCSVSPSPWNKWHVFISVCSWCACWKYSAPNTARNPPWSQANAQPCFWSPILDDHFWCPMLLKEENFFLVI